MRAATVFALFALLLLGCNSRPHPLTDADRIEWLRQHATPVRSLDPEDVDFSDLEPLGTRIGDARVVMLGESQHGDGKAFLAKDRLVRFLHERKGFDVLAWESGLFDCERMQNALSDPRIPINTAIHLGVYNLWADSAEARPVFEYARSTRAASHPLVIVGFDLRLSGREPEPLFDALTNGVDREAPGLLGGGRREALHEVFQRFPNLKTFRPMSVDQRDVDRRVFRELLDALPPRPAAMDAQILRRELLNVIALYDWHEAVGADGPPKTTYMTQPVFENVRDRQMADNLLWTVNERFPTKKVIVWAASAHTQRNIGGIDNPKLQDLIPMGQYVCDALGSQVYSIAITARTGRGGLAGSPPSEIHTAPTGSLEALLHELKRPYVTVGLREMPVEPGWHLVAQPLGHSPMLGYWQRSFDELFEIDEMTPSTSLLVSMPPQ